MAHKVVDFMWEMLAKAGAKRCYGIVGDPLNPHPMRSGPQVLHNRRHRGNRERMIRRDAPSALRFGGRGMARFSGGAEDPVSSSAAEPRPDGPPWPSDRASAPRPHYRKL
jgi:hypothetical protein